MNDSELKYPQWQLVYREAIVEVDRNKLAIKIQKAETAIRERLQTLEQHAKRREELQALTDALHTLRVLKS